MREPVFVRCLAVASDGPEALVDRLLRPSYGHCSDLSGLVVGLELVALAREAA